MVKKYVITGGPGTGKTSVIEELGKEFKIFYEAAREIKGQVEYSKDVQYEIFKKQLEQSKNADRFDDVVFFDRGIPDSLVYFKYHGFEIPKDVLEESKKENTGYEIIFLLDFVPYVRDDVRDESKEEAEKIHQVIYNTYAELGYKIVRVRLMSVKKRVEFVKGFL